MSRKDKMALAIRKLCKDNLEELLQISYENELPLQYVKGLFVSSLDKAVLDFDENVRTSTVAAE